MRTIRAPLLMLAAAVVAGCGGASFEPPRQTRDPMLEKLPEPPVNLPVKKPSQPPAVGQDVRRQTPALPPGDQPGIFVFGDGLVVTRTLDLSGRVIPKNGLIEFSAENHPALQILYRLPSQLRPPTQMTGPGSLAFADRSSPGGPGRHVIVSLGGIPLLGEVWLKSPNPITAELGPGLQLRQRRGSAEGVHGVPVELVQGMKASRLTAVGAVTTVTTSSGPLQTLVEASYMANSGDSTDKYQVGYFLHAWVVRSDR